MNMEWGKLSTGFSMSYFQKTNVIMGFTKLKPLLMQHVSFMISQLRNIEDI